MTNGATQSEKQLHCSDKIFFGLALIYDRFLLQKNSATIGKYLNILHCVAQNMITSVHAFCDNSSAARLNLSDGGMSKDIPPYIFAYFLSPPYILYSMRIRRILALVAVIVVVAVTTPLLYFSAGKVQDDEQKMQLVELWQIDGFEGGKGSRAEYLSSMAKRCFDSERVYFSVTTLTAQAAMLNIKAGVLPDIISYNSGFLWANEIIDDRDFAYRTWCSGMYCLIAADEDADFKDVTASNTVVNAGKDNLADVVTVLAGLYGASSSSPTSAYVQVLNGDYKYLLGTQRDIFRFRARNTPVKVLPLGAFNDLSQNISVTTACGDKYLTCIRYIEYLMTNNDVSSLGLFSQNTHYDDELAELAAAQVLFRLPANCSANYIEQLKDAAKRGDVNKIKSLVK